MQTEDAQHPVEHVGHARHVTGIFQKGNQQKHDGDQRHEAHHPTNPVDDARDNQGLKQPVRDDSCGRPTKPAEETLQPAHGDLSQGKGDMEHGVKNCEHDDRAQHPVG